MKRVISATHRKIVRSQTSWFPSRYRQVKKKLTFQRTTRIQLFNSGPSHYQASSFKRHSQLPGMSSICHIQLSQSPVFGPGNFGSHFTSTASPHLAAMHLMWKSPRSPGIEGGFENLFFQQLTDVLLHNLTCTFICIDLHVVSCCLL